MTSDEELRLRHLDHIQGIITRLAQNSFTVRGWSVSLVSVVLAVLSTQDSSAGLAPIALVPALVFWGLDAYYLRGERLYRQLYRAVANRIVAGPGAPDVSPFDMDLGRYTATVPTFARTLLTLNVLTIPALLVVGVATYRLATW
ncbi:hypothetical protein [Phytohabitans rumicis]|uniref:hypothetical protein n=1 Tax=Phytohabitans rumicis TaxID=1076125 RepID=UPI0031F01B2B